MTKLTNEDPKTEEVNKSSMKILPISREVIAHILKNNSLYKWGNSNTLFANIVLLFILVSSGFIGKIIGDLSRNKGLSEYNLTQTSVREICEYYDNIVNKKNYSQNPKIKANLNIDKLRNNMPTLSCEFSLPNENNNSKTVNIEFNHDIFDPIEPLKFHLDKGLSCKNVLENNPQLLQENYKSITLNSFNLEAYMEETQDRNNNPYIKCKFTKKQEKNNQDEKEKEFIFYTNLTGSYYKDLNISSFNDRQEPVDFNNVCNNKVVINNHRFKIKTKLNNKDLLNNSIKPLRALLKEDEDEFRNVWPVFRWVCEYEIITRDGEKFGDNKHTEGIELGTDYCPQRNKNYKAFYERYDDPFSWYCADTKPS